MCASDALLLAVSKKAKGTMRSLDVSGQIDSNGDAAVSVHALRAVCVANAGTLLELDARCADNLNNWLDCAEVSRLLRSAPKLRRLDADVSSRNSKLLALLHNAGLRVRPPTCTSSTTTTTTTRRPSRPLRRRFRRTHRRRSC